MSKVELQYFKDMYSTLSAENNAPVRARYIIYIILFILLGVIYYYFK
jgi:hypothetical protein